MDRKDELIMKLAKMLEKGSVIMYDCFSEEDAVINAFLGQVPPEVKWAEKAKSNAKQAREFVNRQPKDD